ncbi:hypothetical protein OAA03_00280 [bacterium]|nr:hypothetical protein [bacterium]
MQQMTTAMVTEIVKQTVYQYSTDPSVVLSVVSSGGNLTGLSDTRLQAGSQSTSVTSAPAEGTTAEPSTVTVSYDKITSTSTGGSDTTDSGKTFPVYLDGLNNIQAMTKQDMLDTFIHPAIDLLSSASTTVDQAGTYQISTSSSLSGNTAVSGDAVFVDTRANTGAYTSGSIPETLDQPTTINSYYLQRINGTDTSYTLPIIIDGSNHLQISPEATFETLLKNMVKYSAVNDSGFTISYSINGSGSNRGSGMIDTRLNGSGNYQTRFVNANDYRAQEFPNGTAQTINTYYLKINKS